MGRANDKVSYRFNKHVTAALEKEPGAVYDWMRDVWRRGFDVSVHTLQQGVIPKDLDMFERYWIDQFANLLNVTGNRSGKSNSEIARQVKEALVAQLEFARKSSV